MKIYTEKDGGYYFIVIEGDLDASSCILLDKAIAEAVSLNEKRIIIDCSNLNYISSAGLGVFMSYIQDFENNNISLALCHLSDKVSNVFQILGLDELIRIVPSKDEAKELIK